MYRLKFEQQKIDIAVAEDGKAALKMALRLKPQLLLLDLHLPTFDGVEILSKLRRYEWGKSMKVIVLTNFNETEAPKKLRELGYDMYLVKAHLTPAKLTNTIKRYLATI